MDALSLPKLMVCGLSLCVPAMLTVPASSQPSGADDGLPVLYGVRLDDGQIAIDVASSGCTDESSFSIRLDPESADTYRLTIIRTKRDRCRMAAHVVTLTLDFPAVPAPTGAKLLLMNRLAAPAGLPRFDP